MPLVYRYNDLIKSWRHWARVYAITFYTQAEFEANRGRSRAAWIANLRHEQQNNISYYQNAEKLSKSFWTLNGEFQTPFFLLFCSFKVYTSSFFSFWFWTVFPSTISVLRLLVNLGGQHSHDEESLFVLLCSDPVTPPPPTTSQWISLQDDLCATHQWYTASLIELLFEFYYPNFLSCKIFILTRLSSRTIWAADTIDEFRMPWLPWPTHRKVWHKMAIWTATERGAVQTAILW